MKQFLAIIFLGILVFPIYSQSSGLTLDMAMNRFRQQNLRLLAERCNIDMAHAQVIQAKLFDNPKIEFEQNVYNSLSKRWFDFSETGESIILLEQVIKLAGQRGKLVKYEQINHQLAIAQFEDIVRTLSQTLRATYVELFYATKTLTIFDKEIEQVERLVSNAELLNKQGNLSLMELSRLKALLLSLRREKNDWENRKIELTGQMNILLAFPPDADLVLAFDEALVDHMAELDIPLSSLVQKVDFRPDVRASGLKLEASNANLNYQKSLRAPQFSITGTYDRAGSFIPDYFGVGFYITLPFFNRNQGGVRMASAYIEQSRFLNEFSRQQAGNELMAAFKKYERTKELYRKIDQRLEFDFDQLITKVGENYAHRNISLLEFVDFYTSYKEACLQINEVKRNFIASVEALNTAVGETVIKY